MPTVVPTAQLAPGVCFISGDNNGPFIDTGISIPRRGRVYLSLKAVGPFMRAAGWVPEAEVHEALAAIDERIDGIESVVAEAEKYRAIAERLTPLLPQPEPEVREVAVFKDARVAAQNEQLRAKVRELTAALGEAQAAATKTAASPDTTSEGSAPVSGEPAPSPETPTVTIEDQEVDLDALLDRSVPDVVAVAGSWPEDAKLALLAREEQRRAREDKKPRTTLVSGLLEQGE